MASSAFLKRRYGVHYFAPSHGSAAPRWKPKATGSRCHYSRRSLLRVRLGKELVERIRSRYRGDKWHIRGTGGTGVTSAGATLFWCDQRWDFGKLRPVPPVPRTIPSYSLNYLWFLR